VEAAGIEPAQGSGRLRAKNTLAQPLTWLLMQPIRQVLSTSLKADQSVIHERRFEASATPDDQHAVKPGPSKGSTGLGLP
jgi:hypothetical protein